MVNGEKIILFFLTLVLVVTDVFASGEKDDMGASGKVTAEPVMVQSGNVLDWTNANPSGRFELFSWWAGAEAPALNALIKMFNMKYPDVELENSTVTGGSGLNAKAVLKAYMLGGKPPESFLIHSGQELIGTWVVTGRMVDLTPLFKQEGWLDVFPEGLIPLISTKDGIWSVPVDIHRSNEMWYIPADLKKWGVTVPQTWDDFLSIAPALAAKGIIPLSLGQLWTTVELWENIALAELGPDDWNSLWNGKLSFTDPKSVAVWKKFKEVLKYTNMDAPSLSWQQASDMVVSGQAAFNVMGDWVSGYFITTLKLTPETGFGWASAPGTDGVFQFLADSFVLPKGCANPDAAVGWLKLCGSKAGQDAFNPLKGSIPARTDCDMSLYSAYSKSAAKDFVKDRIVGSLCHGVVASEWFMNDFSRVMEEFLINLDAQQAAASCEALAVKYIQPKNQSVTR